MELLVKRDTFTENTTIGKLFVNGIEYCETLEDKDRQLEDFPDRKVYGKTAIPRGRYEVVIDYSPHYQRNMPHILDVPNYVGVRIHAGNYEKDTEGCLLVGRTRGVDFIGDSRSVFNLLYKEFELAIEGGEKIHITIA